MSPGTRIFLGGGSVHFGVLPDSWSELLLEVTYAAEGVSAIGAKRGFGCRTRGMVCLCRDVSIRGWGLSGFWDVLHLAGV